MFSKINVNLWHTAKQFAACALLTYCLVLVYGSASAEEPDIAATISLIPLPEAPPVELPLTSFQANRENTIDDPNAAKIADRLQEFINDYKTLQEMGVQLNPLGLNPSGMQSKRQHTPASTTKVPQFKPKKPVPSSLMYLRPQGFTIPTSQQNLNPEQSPVQTEDVLEIKMRSIGTPRQIKVKDKVGVQNIMPQAAYSAAGNNSDEQTVRAFLNDYRAYLRVDNPDKELSLNRKESDALNRRHLRFTQNFGGLPVWPAELIVHLDPEGSVDLVDGAFIPTPRKLVTKPVVNAEEAITAARAYVPGSEEAKASQPELIVYGALERPARLAWKLELDISIGSNWTVVVDALNHQILTAFNNVAHENVAGSGQDLFGDTKPMNVLRENGIYHIIDTSKQMFDPTSNPPKGFITITDAKNQPASSEFNVVAKNIPATSFITSNSSTSGWLRDGVSAAFNFSKVYDYYLARHGRNSINGQGGSIYAIVRLGLHFNNAFWSGSANSMYFGDDKPYAGALDVVAHEMTHGVTQNTANLVYQNQPGAMNEAFSDIFGAMVEAYTIGATDWLHGNQLGSPDRSLKDPSSITTGLGPYPSKMSQYYKLPNTDDGDNGGVHINSSIINHAYYQLAAGLNGAIGIRDAERIFYRALTTHLTKQSEFIDARLACIQSAKELFGNSSAQAIKVAEAFDAVEIFDTTPTPTPNPAPPVRGSDATLFVSFDPDIGGYRLARRETALGDGSLGYWLSQSAIKDSRPSVTADGSMAAFVTADNDLCLISTNGSASEDCLGLPGLVYSVAMSPDGERFGFVMLDDYGNPENKITVIELDTNHTHVFSLVAPVSDGLTIDSIEVADAMVFTANSRFLIYDALNVIKVADGSKIAAWSIYAIDLVTGNTLLVVPPKEGLDIGFPALSHTSDDFITFEATNQTTSQSTVLAGNLRTGKTAVVGTVNNDYGVPAYSGDDTAIIYSMPDTNQWTLNSIYKQPLGSDHMKPSGNRVLWLEDADYAVIYRRGAYKTLTVSNNDTSSGVVTSNVGGINCGDSCSFIYPNGTAVNLTAKKYTGSTFVGWGGACSGSGTCTVTLSQDRAVTATFNKAAVIGVPASIKVPSSDADGKYTVSWKASTTSGVTYVLQEATNNTFSAGLRTAYTGIGLSASIAGRSTGKTYYYRVKATKTGYSASASRAAPNGCLVKFPAGVPASIKVPASDADGKYTVSWKTSATIGVTYILQEATNKTFSAGLRTVYTGTGLSASITGRSNGRTYYYRVNATKAGYSASAPRVGTNGCLVKFL